MTMRSKIIIVAIVTASVLPYAAAQQREPASVTALDGPAVVLRAANKALVAQGMALSSGDIIESDANTRWVRIEFDGGAMVDIGPSSRLLLPPPPRAGTAGSKMGLPPVYALAGWIKLAGPAAATTNQADPPVGQAVSAPSEAALQTPALELRTRGVSVAQIGEAQSFVFAETGSTTIVTRRASKAQPQPQPQPQLLTLTLEPGQFASFAAGVLTRYSRPTPEWLAGVPTVFKDKLPSQRRRDAADADAAVTRSAEPVTYPDVQAWLRAEPAVRSALMDRWRSRASDPAFRAALIQNMRSHPEWDRVLFPEKYRPAQAASAAASSAR
jgi:hypothetical protein